MSNFFDKRFWQTLAVAVFSQLIVLVIAVGVSMYIGGYLDQMTSLFDSMNGALTSIQTILNVDPARITEISTSLNEGAAILGDGVGDGGASVVDKVGSAIINFRSND